MRSIKEANPHRAVEPTKKKKTKYIDILWTIITKRTNELKYSFAVNEWRLKSTVGSCISDCKISCLLNGTEVQFALLLRIRKFSHSINGHVKYPSEIIFMISICPVRQLWRYDVTAYNDTHPPVSYKIVIQNHSAISYSALHKLSRWISVVKHFKCRPVYQLQSSISSLSF
jgi:hypothetical protein